MINFDQILRAFNKDDLIKSQENIRDSFAAVSSTLTELEKSLNNWPKLPTGDEETDTTSIEVKLNEYAEIFKNFGILLAPIENGAEYIKLMSLRQQVAEAKKKFYAAKENKETLGPEAVIVEAQNYRNLLPELRQAETQFLYVLMHQWRGAISAVCSDLNEIQSHQK